jgi:hypothetical protein
MFVPALSTDTERLASGGGGASEVTYFHNTST